MPNYSAYLDRQLSLCGEFAALIVCSGRILIMNWRERTAVYVRGLPTGLRVPCVSLVPGYMLLTSQVSTSETQLGIYRLADLANHWTSIVNSPSTASLPDTNFEPLLVKTPTFQYRTTQIRSHFTPVHKIVGLSSSTCSPSSETGDREKFSFRLAGQAFTRYHVCYSTLTYTRLALDSHSSGATLYRLPLGDQEPGMDREAVFENENISVHDISSYGSVVVSM
ncbi:hypothetical protein B0H13DRAFT_2315428 [Mycena leptocephala]|nr:hypothetical protein B0H13DRAFT_2315428 [Mycena leptocephala]